VKSREFITLLGGTAASWPLVAHTMLLVFALTSLGFVVGLFGFVVGLKAESPIYGPVNSADLLGGYILNGEWIEVTGHVWFSEKGVFFNFNLASARVPMLVDVANVDPENIRLLKSTCASPNQFSGGCWATLRGQVGNLDHQRDIVAQDRGILATHIQVTPRQ
jgi:hypothetical protein